MDNPVGPDGPTESELATNKGKKNRPEPEPAPAPATSNIFADATFYVDPFSNARKQADAWKDSRPEDSQQMEKIASRSQADWFGDWNTDVRAAVDRRVGTISATGALPVIVAYNIPHRDCGGLSGGGGAGEAEYKNWIRELAEGIGSRRAAVILEPDALAAMDCLSATDRQIRIDLIKFAVEQLKARPAIAVYIDAGHSSWKTASVMAERLRSAGGLVADGFSLNISNFGTTDSNLQYGESISKLLEGKPFVIDTSRNGLGPTADNQWCNPEGRALGFAPTGRTGHALAHAFLWIKRPGESDGACNGGPVAGRWWADYALGLAQRAT